MRRHLKRCLSICSKCLAASGTALFVLVIAVLDDLPTTTNSCKTDSHCSCPEDWPRRSCAQGKCYGLRPDDRCIGQPDHHDLGNGTFCWKGELVRACTVEKRPAELLLKSCGQLAAYAPAFPAMLGMRLNPNGADAQVAGCAVFSRFGWNDPASKEVLMQLGAIDLIVKALRRFHGDGRVEGACFNSMAALSLYNPTVSLYIGEIGGVEMTVEYWRRRFEDPRAVVANYLGCYQDFCTQNRERMRKAGAIKLALDACGEGGRHFWDAAAQFSCWCGFSSFHTKENHKEFRRLGGMRHIYVVFRDHGKSYRVREEILQATKGLCAWRANREDLAKEGFVEVLTGALKQEKGDPQVQALGMETLRMFVDSNASLRASLVADGGIGIAFDALATHAGKLLNTRDMSWDSQNVYGDFNDAQYNVPGAAAELVYSMALDSDETQKVLIEVGAIPKLDTAIQATQHRVADVKTRTFAAACQALRLLQSAARVAGVEAERQQVLRERACPDHDEHPAVVANDVPFEP